MSPLDVLLKRQSGVPTPALFCLCLALFAFSLNYVEAVSLKHVPDVAWLFSVQFVLAGALPFCYSWDSRLLEGVRRNRFLETAALTCLTPRDWSDGLVIRALRNLAKPALVLYALILLANFVKPVGLLSLLIWLPTVVCLTVTMSYFHQLRSVMDVNRPGRELRQFLVSAPLVLLGFEQLYHWISFVPSRQVWGIIGALPLLAMARWFLLSRLNSLLQGETQRWTLRARALRPWSDNLIVMRESWRSARRGGFLAVFLRRYLIFFLFTGAVAKQVYDVGVGRGPWFIYYNECADWILGLLVAYMALAAVLAFNSTLSAVYDERQQQTAVLLQMTPMSAPAYLNGWIDWATRYRNLELLSTYVLALLGMAGCWWAEKGWDLTRLAAAGTEAHQLVRMEETVGVGILTWMLARCLACLGLWASSGSRSWFSMQMWLVSWLVPYTLATMSVGATLWLMAGMPGALVGTVFITQKFYNFTRKQALQSLNGGTEGSDSLEI